MSDYTRRSYGERSYVSSPALVGRWLAGSRLGEVVERFNTTMSVTVYIVSPGDDHDDPLAQQWVVGWKVIASVPTTFNDTGLPRL